MPNRPGSKPSRAAKPRSVVRAPLAGYSGKPLIDKLGVKPGMRVAALGLDDQAGFLAELRGRTDQLLKGVPRDADMIVARVNSERELAKLPKWERAIRRNGSIWAVWPKGQAHIKEDMVRGAALRHGLVDVKVCAFSAELSALKLVIPVAKR
jgi:hypothetical protein